MKLKPFAIFLLFSLFHSSFSRTSIIRKLTGYRVLADPLGDPQNLNKYDCTVECIKSGVKCFGFRWLNNECQHLTQLRNIVISNSACNDYIIDMREKHSSPFMSKLNFTNQLVYALAYEEQLPCPFGFADNTTSCKIEADETTCQEYANFYNTTFDGSGCIIIPLRSQWYCALNLDNENIIFATTFNGNCYFKVQAPTSKSIAAFNQQCQSISSKSALVSICSHSENIFVASIVTEWPVFLSLHIPASQTARVYNWYDTSLGEYCKYRKYLSTNPSNSEDEPNDYTTNTDTIVGMADDQFWYDYSVASITPATIICKENALSLEDYVAQCQTIDACNQLYLVAPNNTKDEL